MTRCRRRRLTGSRETPRRRVRSARPRDAVPNASEPSCNTVSSPVRKLARVGPAARLRESIARTSARRNHRLSAEFHSSYQFAVGPRALPGICGRLCRSADPGPASAHEAIRPVNVGRQDREARRPGDRRTLRNVQSGRCLCRPRHQVVARDPTRAFFRFVRA